VCDMMIPRSVGVAASNHSPQNPVAVADEVAQAELLGYATLWIPGGPNNVLPVLGRALRSSKTIQVASGILSVDAVPANAVVALSGALEPEHAGRLLLGLGGAHGTRPLATLNRYLDVLDSAGMAADSRVLAALGPNMLALARDRAGGAYPFLVTTSYVTDARAILGANRSLAVLLMVIPFTERESARQAAAVPMRFLCSVGGYRANLLRQGFTEVDIDSVSDRLLDGITAWGSAQDIASRVAEYHAAGADQVVLRMIGVDGDQSETHVRIAQALVGLS
jgi:probable F420-dependent oxidoreductase